MVGFGCEGEGGVVYGLRVGRKEWGDGDGLGKGNGRGEWGWWEDMEDEVGEDGVEGVVVGVRLRGGWGRGDGGWGVELG